MSVDKMKVLTLIGVGASLDEVIVRLGKSGAFEPKDVMTFYTDKKETKKFKTLESVDLFAQELKMLEDVAALMDKKPQIVNAEGFEVSKQEADRYINYVKNKAQDLIFEKKLVSKKIKELEKEKQKYEHFVGKNLNIEELKNCKYLKIKSGKVPAEVYSKHLKNAEETEFYLHTISNDDKYYYALYFDCLASEPALNENLRKISFEEIDILKISKSPEAEVETLNQKIAKEQKGLNELKQNLENLWKSNQQQINRFYTKLKESSTYFEIKKYVYVYKNNFILAGFIPKSEEEFFEGLLDDIYGVEYEIETVDDIRSHPPPIKLKNNWFARPFEMFVKMYGVPAYKEIDPTMFVSITYCLIYGIMFGDVGQGLVLGLIGWLYMWKRKKMVLGQIAARCGVFSTLFGFLYGSVFGNEEVLDPLYKNFFKLPEKPVHVMASSVIPRILVAAVVLGVVLIGTAMVLKIYSSVKQKEYGEALFGPNGVAGLVFYYSLLFGAASSLIIGKTLLLNPFYTFTLILVPLVVIFLKEPLSELLEGKFEYCSFKWGDYIMQNAFEMVVVLLEYILNTLSFFRVGAYILGHAVLMHVFYTLASLCEGFTPAKYLIIIIGNVFVLGLEGMLVGIQVLRLEFYELFSRFFDAKGKVFTPVLAKKIQK